ncbi:MAG: hypothetical protein OXC11_00815 [Rhodospirillales bacterium]|nr:hypothetical protein [Rhodospirillales bacterium]
MTLFRRLRRHLWLAFSGPPDIPAEKGWQPGLKCPACGRSCTCMPVTTREELDAQREAINRMDFSE